MWSTKTVCAIGMSMICVRPERLISGQVWSCLTTPTELVSAAGSFPERFNLRTSVLPCQSRFQQPCEASFKAPSRGSRNYSVDPRRLLSFVSCSLVSWHELSPGGHRRIAKSSKVS